MEVLSSAAATSVNALECEKSECDQLGVVERAGRIITDERQSLAARFRALFVLRNLKCDRSVAYIAQCFHDSSALLKHELAYCLGQMQNRSAIPYLVAVLADRGQEVIVRHEAGEALAAIGDPSVIDVLEKYVDDEEREVAETCQLALKKLQWLQTKEKNGEECSAYNSIDPAPAAEGVKSVTELEKCLVDESLPLWDRYKAMFALRNLSSASGTTDAVKALAKGLSCMKSGALFRHEVAYVLGQIQSEAVVAELSESLRNADESPMVRHECAEALGAIATPECMELVRRFATDNEQVVRESCEVALDMAEYEQSNEFQYATL